MPLKTGGDMKSNPLTRYTAREIHDEFYEPQRLKAEADSPPEVRTKDRHAAKNDAGKSTKLKQQVNAPRNGNSGQRWRLYLK